MPAVDTQSAHFSLRQHRFFFFSILPTPPFARGLQQGPIAGVGDTKHVRVGHIHAAHAGETPDDIGRARLLQQNVAGNAVVLPIQIAHHGKGAVGCLLPRGGLLGNHLAQADARPPAGAFRRLEAPVHIGEILWHLARPITLEVIREGKRKGRGRRSGGIALRLPGRRGYAVYAARFKVERKLSLNGMNVGQFHKPVRWVARTGIGRPNMQSDLGKSNHLELRRLRAFGLHGFNDHAKV